MGQWLGNIMAESSKESTKDEDLTSEDFTEEDALDFMIKTKNSDVTFIVEDRRVHASRAVLSIASPVFSKMLEKNVGKNEFEMPGIKLEHLVEFLKCIYPDILQEINETTVYWVLPLAHKYRVKTLRGKCIKLVLQIVKKEYVNNAEQLYRHIKFSEELDLLEVENLCVDMASECLIDDMEKANVQYSICHGTDVRIIKKALRRRELTQQDENFKQRHILYCRSTRQVVLPTQRQIKPQPTWASDNANDIMQALRLIYKYEKKDVYRKNEALKSLLSLGKLENEDLEVYNLLPEEIKRDLENYNPAAVKKY